MSTTQRVWNGTTGNDVFENGVASSGMEQNGPLVPPWVNGFSVVGLGGDDSLVGGALNDSLVGGAGNDTLRGGGGADSLVADAADTLFGEDGNDLILAGGTFAGATGRLFGGDGVDSLMVGGSGVDLRGLRFDGIERIANPTPSSGTVTMSAAQFREIGTIGLFPLFQIRGEGGSWDFGPKGFDSAFASATTGGNFLGGDLVEDVRGSARNDTFAGGLGDNRLFGLAGNDVLSGSGRLDGGAGNDRLTGGTTDDRLSGGDGLDTMSGGLGADTLRGGADADSLLGGDGNDAVQGEDGDDRLAGGGDADLLSGGNGNDVLVLDAADTLLGEAGDDVLDASGFAGAATGLLGGGAGNDALRIGPGGIDLRGATVSSIERLEGVGPIAFFDIHLTAGQFAVFREFSLFDRATFVGDGGTWNFAAKLLVPGSFTDTVRFRGGDQGETVKGSAARDEITVGLGPNQVDGGAGDDVLSGAGTLRGGEGMDTLTGSGEADRLSGDAGADSLLGGDGADRLAGGADADVLLGQGGDDTIFGGDGADTLSGGAGTNRLSGGADADVFVLDRGGVAAIEGFVSGEDRIGLEPGDAFGLSGPFAETMFEVNATGVAAALAGAGFVYATANGRLFFDPDGAGGVAGELVATFAGRPALAWTDVLIG